MRDADLDRQLAVHGEADCTCPHEYKGLGILYGVSMGKGWVRMTDDPNCPHHGRRAARAGGGE